MEKIDKFLFDILSCNAALKWIKKILFQIQIFVYYCYMSGNE